MAKVITLGLQKGGVSKTTTAGILSHLLSEDGNKVLAIDMDSQGNLTELLTDQSANNFINKSIFEAIVFNQPREFIHKINKNLHIIPANNFLASFARWVHTGYYLNFTEKISREGHVHEQLDKILKEIRHEYDYIIIDTPPALSEQTSNALYTSDYVIVLFECSKFCYSAIANFMDSVDHFVTEKLNPDLKTIGILRTLNDRRRSDAKIFNEAIANDYPDLVFDTIITRKATTGRLPLLGFEENPEINEALSQYIDFYKELLERMKESEKNNE